MLEGVLFPCVRTSVRFQMSVWCVITDCFGYSIVGCSLLRVLTLSRVFFIQTDKAKRLASHMKKLHCLAI